MKIHSAKRNGLVLIIVTVVLLLISLAAVGLVTLMQTEYRASRQRAVELELENAAASGRSYLMALASQSRSEQSAQGGLAGNASLFVGCELAIDPKDTSGARFSLYERIVPQTGDSLQPGPTCESAKLHLQELVVWDRLQAGVGHQALMKLPGMTSEVADAILDWVDPDSQPRNSNSEHSVSGSKNARRMPRNACPPHLDELLEIPGVSRELLWGYDELSEEASEIGRESRGRSGRSEPRAARLLARPWQDFLSVSSKERNEDFEGRPRIFVNMPDLASLHQQLTSRLDIGWANYVVAYRQFGPTNSKSAGQVDVFQLDLSKPARFTINSELDLIGSRVAVAGSQRNPKILSSPLAENRVGWTGQLSRVMDQITVDPRDTIPGRVNIDLASREVLLAIPGFDMSVVDRVLAARTLSADGRHSHAHASWILEQGIIDLAMMKRLLPKITTGGDVWGGQIITRLADREAFACTEFAVDATSKRPFELYCKDIRDLVTGLPDEMNSGTSSRAKRKSTPTFSNRND